MGGDPFSGAWRVRETVFSPSGLRLGEVAQRRVVANADDGTIRVIQVCEPDAVLRSQAHPMVAFEGEHVFSLSIDGPVRRYHGPAVQGGALTIGDGAMIGRGVWPRFGWVFWSWSVRVAPDRQLTGGRFHRGGAPMATIVGVAAPESVSREAPRLGETRWPGASARTWKGTRCRIDGTGRVIAEGPAWRRYLSQDAWEGPESASSLSARDDAFLLEGVLEGRPMLGFARRFGWMIEAEAVVGDDTILESIEVFDEAAGHLVVLERWLVDQMLQRAEVVRLRPEADA
jgi:hypothetical protein